MKLDTVTKVYKFIDKNDKIRRYGEIGTSIALFENKFAELLYEKKTVSGNVFLNEGINYMWRLVCGELNLTPFNSENAHIGVGDGTTAESPEQTGLTGSNKYYKKVDSGYPIFGSEQKAVFRATFGSGEANFTWNEWTVANGAGDQFVNLNRKVENLGTKTSGSTWIIEIELRMI